MSSSVISPRQARMDALGDEVCRLAATIHAATAKLAVMVAAFDAEDGWGGAGMRCCAHWLSLNAGFDLHSGDELVRVGHALESLPALRGAFDAGELSLDKVRAVTRVATPEDEDIWVHLAQQASASQLSRICRAVRRAIEVNDPARADAQLSRRGLWTQWDDDGMLRLRALLTPDDGAVVLAALEGERLSQEGTGVQSGEPVPDPAGDLHAARRADALVTMCATACAAGAGQRPGHEERRLVVHVDLGVLTGAAPEGRCNLDNGPALSTEVARRIGCDAEVVAVIERDGLPVDVARARRVVPPRLRRALESRDQTCRFPGCAVPVRMTHAHHVKHWADGGATSLANLASLCGFHHRRLHDGAFHIAPDGAGQFTFTTAGGDPITVRRLHRDCTVDPEEALMMVHGDGCTFGPHTPWAHDGGRYDHDHAVMVISDAVLRRRRVPSIPDG